MQAADRLKAIHDAETSQELAAVPSYMQPTAASVVRKGHKLASKVDAAGYDPRCATSTTARQCHGCRAGLLHESVHPSFAGSRHLLDAAETEHGRSMSTACVCMLRPARLATSRALNCPCCRAMQVHGRDQA